MRGDRGGPRCTPCLSSSGRCCRPGREARRLLIGTLVGAVGNGMTLPFLFVYLTKVRHLDPSVVGAARRVDGPARARPRRTRRHPARPSRPPPGAAAALRGGCGRRRVLRLRAHRRPGLRRGHARRCRAARRSGPARTTLLSTVTSEQERQRVFGLSFAILNLGIGAGGFVAGFIADVHRRRQLPAAVPRRAAPRTLAPAAVLLSLPTIGHRLGPADGAVRSRPTGGYRDVFADRAFRRFLAFALLITVCGYAQIEVGFPAFASLQSGVSVAGDRLGAGREHADDRAGADAGDPPDARAQPQPGPGRRRRADRRCPGSILGLSSLARDAHPALAVVGVVACAIGLRLRRDPDVAGDAGDHQRARPRRTARPLQRDEFDHLGDHRASSARSPRRR